MPCPDAPMEEFIHRQNLEHYRKQRAETTDEARRRLLEKLLAEEEVRENQMPPTGGQSHRRLPCVRLTDAPHGLHSKTSIWSCSPRQIV
jgi:hypothetical protein